MKQFRKISYRSLAGFLMIWLSGVVFLLCCTEINGKTADKEFCPLAKMSAHCDKAGRNESSQAFTSQTKEQEMNCCAFISVFFDKNRKIDSNQQFAAHAPAASVERPKLISAGPIFTRTILYHSITPRKNNTYLKNCTFRI